MEDNEYPNLVQFSNFMGILPANLIKVFKIEKEFHEQILKEDSLEKRQVLYSNVYNAVHELYGRNQTMGSVKNPTMNNKARLARLFSRELRNKSILEVGCGEGSFLACVAKSLPHKKLVGMDISMPPASLRCSNVEFKVGDIIRFDLNSQFDVVFSDQVIEHIAPQDLPIHLSSVKASLKPGGIFIVSAPNRLFGPSDITRIIDFSYTGKTRPQGTHLNEMTYNELISTLERNGFKDFKTVCPLPKLKDLLINFRMQPLFLQAIERSSLILMLLRSIKLRGQCIARFGVTLICRKH